MTAPDARWGPLELLRWTTEFFGRQGIATPRLDAEVLLAHVLETERIGLYLRFEQPVGEAQRARFRELVRLRARDRLPVAYLTGVREFWSRPFAVSGETLIPRPETETLVQAVVELAPRRFADVGTGCGAIAAALALELPGAKGVAVDRSRGALALAGANLARFSLGARVLTVQSDGLEAVRGPFDAIVSNPPYVASAELDSLEPELRHEPRLALDGGRDGLDFLRRLFREAPGRLARPGHLAVEVGAGQAAAALELGRDAGASGLDVRKDLAGVERVVVARFEER